MPPSAGGPASQNTVVLGTATPGGGFPVYGAAFADTVNETEPTLAIEQRNTKGSTENVPLLEAGRLDLALVQGEVAHEAFNGIGRPAVNLPIVAAMYSTAGMFVVRADSPHRTVHDLRGTPVAFGARGSGLVILARYVLDGLGLDQERDFQAVYLDRAGDGPAMVLDGRVAALWGGGQGWPGFVAVAQGPAGGRFIVPDAEGIRRKGLILSFLTRFKQICNHPSQWLGDASWAETDSGKFGRLREIAEIIAARQDKMLVFTQFREVTNPLAAFLGSVFGRPGFVLHGETQIKQRGELVRRFQEDESIPFFVLSLKAGGTGLNLTAAAHVVHFDRWWNPAVENQATDRAFRIGQRKNVLVHKLVCRGTVEEKIDQLIESKRRLSRDLLEGGAELLLTEMKDDEILKLVALDIHAASQER